jgi:hypothetical protein
VSKEIVDRDIEDQEFEKTELGVTRMQYSQNHLMRRAFYLGLWSWPVITWREITPSSCLCGISL